jgi:phage-related protein
MTNPDEPFVWIGSTQGDLLAMPPRVRRDIGHALHAFQQGMIDPAAQPTRTSRGAPPILAVIKRYRNVKHHAHFSRYDDAVWVLRAYPAQSDAAASKAQPESDRTDTGSARQHR